MSSSPPSKDSANVPPQLFLELAELYEQRDEPKMRDRFLILAADAAFSGGQLQQAERLHQHLLQVSPHHMLKGYRSFAEAVRAEPVRAYIHDLKQNYPNEVVHRLLESLRGRTVPVDTMKAPPSATAKPLVPPSPTQPEADWTALMSDTTPPAPAHPAQPGGGTAKGWDLANERMPRRPPPPATAATPAARPPARQPALPAAPLPATRTRSSSEPAQTNRGVKSMTNAKKRRKAKTKPTSWLVMLLFVLVFVSGLALLGYSLARPFLP